MAKIKRMFMGGAAKAAMQPVKAVPRTYAAPAGTPKANMGGGTAGVPPASGGPVTKPGMQGLGQAMGARPQGSALGQAAATKLGQAAATKLGQITGRPNMPSPSVVKSPFVPPQTQRPAVQTPQQRDQQAQQQRAAGMASMGVKPLTPPPSGLVAPRGFGPPPGMGALPPRNMGAMPGGMGALPPRDMGRPNMPPSLPPAGKLPFGQRPEVPQRPAVQTRQTAPPPIPFVQTRQTAPSEQQPQAQAQAQAQAQLDAKAKAEAERKFLQSQQKPPVPVTGGMKQTPPPIGMNQTPSPMKKGGMVSSKPKASSASSRGDGIATKGKTKGRFV